MDWKDWKEYSESDRRACYESYVADVIYENGDRAQYLTYEEWCKESEEFGEPLCADI